MPKISDEELIVAWQGAPSAKAVHEMFKDKVDSNYINGKVYLLRKKGVPLRKFKKGTLVRKDYAALTKLAQESLK